MADSLDDDPRRVDELAVTCGAPRRVLPGAAPARGVWRLRRARRTALLPFRHEPDPAERPPDPHPRGGPDARRAGSVSRFGAFRHLARDRRPSLGRGHGRAVLRLAAPARAGGRLAVQRRDDRHPRRRAAGDRGGVSVRRHRDRRRRRLGQHDRQRAAPAPAVRGVVFDMPHVVVEAQRRLEGRGPVRARPRRGRQLLRRRPGRRRRLHPVAHQSTTGTRRAACGSSATAGGEGRRTARC